MNSRRCVSLEMVPGEGSVGAVLRGESVPVPHKIKRFPGSVGIPVCAQRIQMLEQHVPCNLVIALRAVTEIRTSVGSEEPRWLSLSCLAFSELLYLFHCVLGRKADPVCYIAANSVCVRGALNVLIS